MLSPPQDSGGPEALSAQEGLEEAEPQTPSEAHKASQGPDWSTASARWLRQGLGRPEGTAGNLWVQPWGRVQLERFLSIHEGPGPGWGPSLRALGSHFLLYVRKCFSGVTEESPLEKKGRTSRHHQLIL